MKKGFTLVEMLVVIGIIAILMGATALGYSKFIKKGQESRGTEFVHQVKTAMESLLQSEKHWPRAIRNEGAGGNGEMTPQVGAELARRGLLSLTWKKTTNNKTGETTYTLTGNDQFGVVTPWAEAVIKRALASGSVSESTRVPSGGTIADHRLRFAIDDDEDGITEVQVSATGRGSARVRAPVCVWCYGYDGKPGTKDDIYSWSPNQEEH